MKGKFFVLGFLTPVVLGLLLGFAVAKLGYIPSNADDKPGMVERRVAGLARDAYFERNAVSAPDIAADPATLQEGLKLYRSNCAECHGTGVGPSMFGQSFYPAAPQWDEHGPHDDTYLLVYVAKHGIRLTGMPAFGSMLKDEELWKILTFVKHIKDFPADLKQDYQTRPGQAAANPSPSPSQVPVPADASSPAPSSSASTVPSK